MPFNHTQTLTTNLKKIESHDIGSDSNVIHLKTAVTTTPTAVGHGPLALTSNEQRDIHQAVFDLHLQGGKILSRQSENSLLADITVLDDPFTACYELILTIWESEEPAPKALVDLNFDEASAVDEKPTVSEDASACDELFETFYQESASEVQVPLGRTSKLVAFKQSPLPPGHEAGLRWRWYSIHSATIDATNNQWRSTLDRTLARTVTSGVERVRFYRIPVEITGKPLQLGEVVNLMGGAENVLAKPFHSGIPLDQFESLATGAIECNEEILASDTLESDTLESDTDDSAASFKKQRVGKTLEVRTTNRFNIRLGPDSLLVASSKPHTDVLLVPNNSSLAGFVRNHHFGQVGNLQAPDGVSTLTTMLRGVKVQLKAGGKHEDRTISGFRKGLYSELPKDQTHYMLSTWGGPAPDPALPSVNVGSIEKPLYVSMELCFIREGQRLRGPRDPQLSLAIEKATHKNNLALQASAGQQVPGLFVVDLKRKSQEASLNTAIVHACDGCFPNLLFVEAGSGPFKFHRWSKLRNAFESLLLQSFKDHAEMYSHTAATPVPTELGNAMPLLSLKYNSGTDPTADWTRRLKNFITRCHKPSQKTIVIVWLEPEQSQNTMYKVIKKACDLTVGAQTFFVNHATYQNKVFVTPEENVAIMQTAGSIRRRLPLRMPRMLKGKVGSQKGDLVVAMHVTPISTPTTGARSSSKDIPGFYLVTFVSRHLKLSEQYHTEIGIFTRVQMQSQDHMALLQKIVDLLPDQIQQNLTILRSGYMSPFQGALSPTSCVDLTNNASFETPIMRHESESLPETIGQSSMSRHPNVDPEIKEIHRRIATLASPGKLTYITLSEDTGLETQMDTTALKSVYSDDSTAMIFIKDRELVNFRAHSVKVQYVQGSSKKPYIGPGAITVTYSLSGKSFVRF